jgi:antitoxin component of MazEF toxin-antitoxin module
MRGLPHGRIVHVQIVANSPHHHLAGVQADTDLQLQAVDSAHLLAVGAQRRLHGQGGVAGAPGVIFMGNGGTEQGHNAIAEHLVHRALEAVHSVHHTVDGRVEELLGGFRVEALDQLGGVFDVGKQHRDLFALTFQGGTGGQNLLRQMWRRVGQRRWFRLPHRQGGRGVSHPHQHLAVFVAGQTLGVDDLGLEILEVLVVERKASFERPIGHTSLVLEQVENLGHDFVKRHTHSSTLHRPLSLRTCTRRSLRHIAIMAETAYRVNDRADDWGAWQRRRFATAAEIPYNRPYASCLLWWVASLLTQEVNGMQSTPGTETTKLHISKDGTLRIPAHVVSAAQLRAGDEVTVRVKPKQLALVGGIRAEELLAQFVHNTHRLLANVDESYRMADGLTLGAYLALSDAEREALWQQAIQEAHDAGEHEPEHDIPAHYVPAGQKHRARRVRGKG